MNRVSDERLAELIAEIDNIGQEIETVRDAMEIPEYLRPRLLHPEIVFALRELQSLRQASVAGVEEAARSICNTFVRIKNDNLHHSNSAIVRRLQQEAIAAELTALLAERDAKIKKLELATLLVGAIQIDPQRMSGAPCVKGYQFTIAQLLDELAHGGVTLKQIAVDFNVPLEACQGALQAVSQEVKDLLGVCGLREKIAERDAVLRECREVLTDATRIHRHVYVDGRCKSCRLLARINAIIGKEGDGA